MRTNSGEAGDERRGAEQVEPAVRIPAGELVQHGPPPGGAGERERDVEPEHPVPGDRDERAAEHRPEHEPDRGDHGVRPHGEAELLAREGVRDQRGGVGEQERGADALDDAPQDQLGAALREARAQRREREHDDAADVGLQRTGLGALFHAADGRIDQADALLHQEGMH